MIWHIFQNPLCVETEKGKNKLLVQKLTFDKNFDTFITYIVPTASLILRHIYEGSNSRESEHRRAATKGSEMKYFTLSPGFLHCLKSSALPSSKGCAQLQHVLPWESVHTCKCTHAHTSTCIHMAKQRRNKKKKRKKGEKKQGLGCLWVCFTPTLFCFASPLHRKEQGDWSNNQSVMWHFAKAFILHNSCYYASSPK